MLNKIESEENYSVLQEDTTDEFPLTNNTLRNREENKLDNVDESEKRLNIIRVDTYAHALKTVGKVLVPSIINNVIFYGAGFVDGIIIGRLGSEVLASSSIISNLKQFSTIPAGSTFYALQPLIVLSKQESNFKHSVGQLMRASFLLSSGFSLVLIPITITSHYLVRLINEQYADHTEQYFNFYAISIPAQFFIQIINNFLLSTDKAFAVAPFCLIRTLTDIGATALMIYGLNMGVKGWGIATGVQPWLAIALISVPIISKKVREYLKNHGVFDRFVMDRNLLLQLKEIFKLGWPISLQSVFMLSNGLGGSLLVARIGKNELASYQIALSVSLLSIIFLDPMTVVLSIVLPSLSNESSRTRVLRTVVGLSAIGSIILLVLPSLFYDPIVKIFNPSSEPEHQNILLISKTLIPIMSTTAPLYVTKAILTGILRSEKKTIAPFIAEGVSATLSAIFSCLAIFIFNDTNFLCAGQMLALLVCVLILLPTVICNNQNADKDRFFPSLFRTNPTNNKEYTPILTTQKQDNTSNKNIGLGRFFSSLFHVDKTKIVAAQTTHREYNNYSEDDEPLRKIYGTFIPDFN